LRVSSFFLEPGADIETVLTCVNLYPDNILERDSTPLKVAAQLDNVPMACLLLEHRAELVQYDKFGHPIYGAIHAARSAEMVQLLLDHHADPKQHVYNGLSPLHFYAKRGNFEAMRAVLRNGVEVDARWGEYASTPLHYAALHNIDAVKLLLDHGADLKKKGFRCETPLHSAAKAGKTDVVRLLLEQWPEATREKDIYGIRGCTWWSGRGMSM
jgi:ankyrin repeat protein